MSNHMDISGDVYGRLTAVRRIDSRDGKTFWLCKCTCGNETSVYLGHLRGGRTVSCGCFKKDILKASTGGKNKNWKGGRAVTEEGYVTTQVNGKRVLEHRHVMETYLGRPLTNKEIIHHLDENKQNNVIGNLEVTMRDIHTSRHNIKTPVIKKLTKHSVHRIREFNSVGISRKELSEAFHISRRHLHDIISGKYWRVNI